MFKKIILIISILLLTGCVSQPEKNYVIKTVYTVPPLYFYDFPKLGDSIVIPLDVENKRVTSNEEEIVNVIIPYWYLMQIYAFSLHYQETIDSFNYYKEFYKEETMPIRITGKLFTEGEIANIKKIITKEIDVKVLFSFTVIG